MKETNKQTKRNEERKKEGRKKERNKEGKEGRKEERKRNSSWGEIGMVNLCITEGPMTIKQQYNKCID
jgi:hypothetical protein